MSAGTKSEFTKAVKDLADGFISLEAEFKALASQHAALKRQLVVMSRQDEKTLALDLKLLCSLQQALRRLIPEQEREHMPDMSASDVELSVASNTLKRNVIEWVGELRGSTNYEAEKTLVQIRDAELACFKIQERLKGKVTTFQETPAQEEGDNRKEGSATKKRGGRISFTDTDIERDYTLARTPGQLGCPFASMGGRKANSTGPPPPYVPNHNPPTPRGSGSQIDTHHTRSSRPSFNDPIRPELEAPPSEASDQGPACPIRFLDRHTPEDVAKYFEEHKHELPRSHEFCVKRFQTNSESIKALDAKYGNLVNMIQGLGQKHQPMLPEAPQIPEVSAVAEDSKSQHRVRNWAKAVSVSLSREASIPDALPEDDTKSNDVEDERLPHFDRPLKEIRVGESPSRPWGVPIPSKYLDVTADPDGVEVEAERDGLHDMDRPERTEHKSEDAALDEKAQRPKGKCPFGHGAPIASAPAAPEPEASSDKAKVPETAVVERRDLPALSESAKPSASIVNHGLALVADPAVLSNTTFENRGTLVLGYTSAEVGSIQSEYYSAHK